MRIRTHTSHARACALKCMKFSHTQAAHCARGRKLMTDAPGADVTLMLT